MTGPAIPPRWAFERVEHLRCAYLGLEPNPLNIDVVMSNPEGWRDHHAWAAFIAQTEQREPPADIRTALWQRVMRLYSDAERLAADMRIARDEAPAGQKANYRYPLRAVEQAAALIRKAGI